MRWDNNPENSRGYTPVYHPLPLPDAGDTMQPPLVCVRYSAALHPYVVGALHVLPYQYAYVGGNRDIQSLMQDLIALFAEAGLCGVDNMSDYRLRQSDDNLCLLEQSIDGGLTWLPAFDFSLCNSNIEILAHYQLQQQYTNTVNAQQLFEASYNGANDSIIVDNPTAAASYDTDPVHERAFCQALKLWVQATGAMLEEYAINQEQQSERLPVFVLGLIGVGLTIVTGGLGLLGGVIAGGLGFAGTVVGASLSGLALAVSQFDGDYSLFRSGAILKYIVCCVKQNLNGTLPSNENEWRALFSAPCGDESADEQKVREAMATIAGSTNAYLDFMDLYDLLITQANNGTITLPDCPLCGFDVSHIIEGAKLTHSYNVYEWGAYDTGLGVMRGEARTGSTKSNWGTINFPSSTYVTTVVIETYDQWCSGCSGRPSTVKIPDDGSIVNETYTRDFTAGWVSIEYEVYAYVDSIRIEQNASGEALYRRTTINMQTADGTNPFEGLT